MGSTQRYGDMLRRLRTERGLSQLGLASLAGVSTRHLSFLETGRSAPSREMVDQLCEALGVPLRDRNPLLVAAGFAPSYASRSFDSPELAGVRDVLGRWIAAQDPFPALVIDRAHDVVMLSPATVRWFALVFDGAMPAHLGRNLARIAFHPDGLRRSIRNFDVVASVLVRRMRRETTDPHESARLEATICECLSGVRLDVPTPDVPIVSIAWDVRGERVDTISTIATFGSASDATVSELRIETVLPVDAESERRMRRLSAAVSD